MEIVVWITICVVCLAGGFGAGGVVFYPKGIADAPKTNMIVTTVDSTTEVKTETDTRQTSMQGQITIIINGPADKTEYFNVNLKDITNMVVDRKSFSNTIVKTNM